MSSSVPDSNSLARRIADASPWFHSIDLGGTITPGASRLDDQRARADVYFQFGVSGASVLDVGAWDGYYSFEAERRGASRVLAVDKYVWDGRGWGNRRAFELARETLASRVEDRILDLAETTRANVGAFDIVLFNSIIYHASEPVSALRAMADIARRMLVVETFVDNVDNPQAAVAFYPAETAEPGYPPDGWGPNPKFMHAMLRHVGFPTVLEYPTPDEPIHRRIFLAFKSGMEPDGLTAASSMSLNRNG